MKKSLAILMLIILIGGVVRFWSLSDNHIGFFRDEAALGLNAWSIYKTGADEYGQKFPIVFRSFEVFFMPLYVYLSVPIMAIFGLSEFSTRFLSTASGVLLIFLAYLIAKQIFSSERVAILSAIVVAFSPWAIFYSRGAFEGNLALLFFTTGFYFWLRFENKGKIQDFSISLIIFVLSMYSYQAPRLVVPIFLILAVLSHRGWTKKWKIWTYGIVLASVLYLPIALLSLTPAGYHRAIGVSIFSNSQGLPGFSKDLGQWQNLYIIPREIASLFLHYFSPYNLFQEADYNKQRIIEGFSAFYIWQLPILVLGLWTFFKGKYNKKTFLIWLLIAPIPASLTLDPFHTYRALLLFVPLCILIGLGFENLLKINRISLKIIITIFVIAWSVSVTYFLFSFFIQTPVFRWKEWDFGYRQIAEFIKTQPNNLQILIDDPNTESYIHLLFYQALPLTDYQKASEDFPKGFYYNSVTKLRPQKIGRLEIRKVDWSKERGNKNTLFIFSSAHMFPSEFSGDPKLKLEKTITAPSGEAAFYIIRSI